MSNLNDLNLDSWFDEDEALKAINDIDTGRFWRPKENKTIIRILPPIKANGEKLFYFTHRVHWINRMPYECINQTLVDKDGVEHVAESCPICSLAKQLFKMGETDEEALKEARAISAKSKDVVRILVRDEDGTKVHFYEMPLSAKNMFLNAISSGDWGSPIIHPVTGNDFSLQRTGSGTQTKYDSSYIMPKETPIASTKEGIIEILQTAQRMPFNSMLSFLTADELKRVLREYAGRSKDDSVTSSTKEVSQEKHQSTQEVGPRGQEKITIQKDNDQNDALDDLLSELTGLDGDLPF